LARGTAAEYTVAPGEDAGIPATPREAGVSVEPDARCAPSDPAAAMGRGAEVERPAVADLRAGIERFRSFEVAGALLTDVGGTLRDPVLSTPGMIAIMERNAAMLAYEHLPAGLVTVGFEICVRHVATAARGAVLGARAVLRDVAPAGQAAEVGPRTRLRFDVEVLDGERTVGFGTHERRVVAGG
jgi:predicted thioesterase